MRYGSTRLACLTLALLLTCMLAYVLSPAAIDRRVESFSGGEVTTSYTHGPKLLTDNLPVIQVTDASGNSVDSLIINVFAVMPHANVKYLGAVGSDSNTVILPYNITSKISSEIIPTWRNELKHLGGLEPSLLLFIDAVRKLSNGTYAVYPQVKAVPLNLQLLSKGYKLNSIKIKINTNTVKPSIITLNTTTPHIKSAPPNTTNQGCIVLHNGPRNLIYCTKWKFQKECAHLKNTLIPVIVLRIPRGHLTNPQRIFEAQSFLILNGTSPTRLEIHAGIRLSNASQDSYETIETLTNFSFSYMCNFFNRRWTSERVQFTDDAIIAVGFKGSIALDSFRRYYALCKGSEPWCPEEKYLPTNAVANITLTIINVTYDGLHWVAAFGYDIDDTVGDGKGWDRYWSLAEKHMEPGEISSRKGSATYEFTECLEDCIGVDVADLVSMIVGDSKLSTGFPTYVGIDVTQTGKLACLILINVADHNDSNQVRLTLHVSRSNVLIDGASARLRLMMVDVEDYPVAPG